MNIFKFFTSIEDGSMIRVYCDSAELLSIEIFDKDNGDYILRRPGKKKTQINTKVACRILSGFYYMDVYDVRFKVNFNITIEVPIEFYTKEVFEEKLKPDHFSGEKK